MKQKQGDNLPKNAIEAQGMLIKAFYKKFGKEALPLIADICNKQGRALGLKVKRKVSDNCLSTVANAFSKSYDPDDITVVEVSDTKFQIQGNKCPFGLENTSRALCEAVMEIDAEYFRTAVSKDIKLSIIKTVAAGDKFCDTIYTLKDE